MSSLFDTVYDSAFTAATAVLFKAHALYAVGVGGSHSLTKFIEMNDFSVEILPALANNYMYMIIDNETREAAIVDPVDPERVLKSISDHEVQLKSILTTHHYWDHASGNGKLSSLFDKSLKVYGGDDRINALTHKVTQDEEIRLGSLTVRCLLTPCHTKGSVCYYIDSSNGQRAVFTGDTLFLGTCGAFFEGDAAQMHAALFGQLSLLPDDTLVFCGHESGMDTLKYAKEVEPNNQDVLDKFEDSKKLRADNLSTLPTTIGTEKLINPFMRVNTPSVQQYTGTTDEIETLATLRKKNYYYVLRQAAKFPFSSCLPSN